jgi:hypothetical protein
MCLLAVAISQMNIGKTDNYPVIKTLLIERFRSRADREPRLRGSRSTTSTCFMIVEGPLGDQKTICELDGGVDWLSKSCNNFPSTVSFVVSMLGRQVIIRVGPGQNNQIEEIRKLTVPCI